MNCSNCPCYHVVSDISETLVITLRNEPTNLNNEDKICFLIPKWLDIPDAPTTAVTININGIGVEIRDRFGNPMVGNDLRNCLLYCGYYGSEGIAHVQIVNVPRRRCRL